MHPDDTLGNNTPYDLLQEHQDLLLLRPSKSSISHEFGYNVVHDVNDRHS